MGNTRRGARKAAKTTKARHGADHYRKIGAKGGRTTARRYFGK